MEVVPEEAETVRLIYRLFMQGQTPYAIAKYLTDRSIPTPTGKETWRHRTVENILSNEKYKGDARLQKCYTVDFLPRSARRTKGRCHNCCSPFSAKLKCGHCGEYFGSKVWYSNSKYKRTVWQCNAKFKGESKCATSYLYEQRIKELFLEAAGILMEKREEVIGDCRVVMEALADRGSIDTEMEAVSSEMEVTAGLIQNLVDENAAWKLDQHDYRKKYDGYASRYAALESRMDSLENERERKEIQYDIFSGFFAGLA